MPDFLRGLVRSLERHATVLRDRLAALTVDPEVQPHVVDAYQRVERVRREVEHLLRDATLSNPAFQSNHLRTVRDLERRVDIVESYQLPFLERFGESDRRLTRLCARLTQQVRWPLPPPLVVAFSNQYYWTLARFPLICAPAAEVHTLLRLPDLCHELGHKLLDDRSSIIRPFIQEVIDYIDREKRRAITGQRPVNYLRLYDQLLSQWLDRWVWEFGADMVAAYLTGEAFGWQHVRLSVGQGPEVYHPSFGEAAEHPADEARLRGILAVLQRLGATQAATGIHTLWLEYAASPGSAPPTEYGLAYPQGLIDTLADTVVDGCRGLAIRGFDEIAERTGDIIAQIMEAWEHFLGEPDTFASWEQTCLDDLWRELGC